MKHTKETWKNFVKTLAKAQTEDNAITANPIFCVQEKLVMWGKDKYHSYDTDCFCTSDGDYHENGDDLYACLEAEEKHELNGIALKEFGDMFSDLNSEYQEKAVEEWDSSYSKVYGSVYWSDVCTHLTKEAAERYIQKNAHNHKELRVYVKSLNQCPEFIALVQGILGGQIDFIGEKESVTF
ncbi:MULTISPECIES: hypothetical protein [Acinetobacter]|uniref:Bacteriophage protein n=1 Tax=Acinetobacter pollinis TaxID=2605270 RepID=A0ABU6DUS2_9GAMM|nr:MULTISPECIES: hypothetical protein [Acinetobacter]MCF9034690.1 hypothetical protein [Acinetobacter nectaris]MEB5477612.1 hypothetical protein [Acinetobacter pollinis]